MLRCRPQPVLNGLVRISYHPFRSISRRMRHGHECSGGLILARLVSSVPLQGRSYPDNSFSLCLQLHICRKTMKKLQQLFASAVLTLILSVSTFAGDGVITTWRTEPPPPPAAVATNNEAEAEGVITTWYAAADSATEVVLSLLPSVLALF